MKQPVSSIMKQTLCAASSIIFAALYATSASAQSPDKIIRQAVKAMTNGKGEKALREIRSWEVKGRITNTKDGSTGGYRAYAMRPNPYPRAFDLGGVGGGMGYNSKKAWTRASPRRAATVTGVAGRGVSTQSPP